MGASSITGKGPGESGKATMTKLAILANHPGIIYAGTVESSGNITSPPSPGGVVTFSKPLPGNSEEYVVLLTTIGGGAAYVTNMDEDDDGNFESFGVVTATECDVMFLVTKKGMRGVPV